MKKRLTVICICIFSMPNGTARMRFRIFPCGSGSGKPFLMRIRADPNPKNCLPRLAPGLHVVGQRDVIGPDVVLPLAQPEDAAEDPARVEANTHAQIHLRGLHNRPEHAGNQIEVKRIVNL